MHCVLAADTTAVARVPGGSVNITRVGEAHATTFGSSFSPSRRHPVLDCIPSRPDVLARPASPLPAWPTR